MAYPRPCIKCHKTTTDWRLVLRTGNTYTVVCKECEAE